ncbi:hypothetical protein ACHAXT_002674 [Thalassiosira profunda]
MKRNAAAARTLGAVVCLEERERCLCALLSPPLPFSLATLILIPLYNSTEELKISKIFPLQQNWQLATKPVSTPTSQPHLASRHPLTMASSPSDITVLVCSANVGNAEPTPASFAQWVPHDGEIDAPVSSTQYPVAAEGVDEALASLKGKKKQFDIIVLGMQEAAFVEKSAKKESSGDDLEGLVDASASEREQPGERIPVVDDVVEAANNAVAGLEKETEKTKRWTTKTLRKGSLMIRGLTAQQAYKAPAVRQTTRISRISENNAITKAARSAPYDTRKFAELVEQQCLSYELVAAKLRGEMRLIVLARKEIAGEITDVHMAGENTGIGSVLANKGGIICTLTLRGTRLSFMTCHLEAHEGLNHYANRNKNLAEIFAGAKTDPAYHLHDATIISHHMFLCGDLNYRIRFGENEELKKKKKNMKNKLRSTMNMKRTMMSKKGMGSSTTSKKDAPLVDGEALKGSNNACDDSADAEEVVAEENEPVDETNPSNSTNEANLANPANGSHFAAAKALVEAEDWQVLNDGDELAMALEKKECLVGFKTLPCNWPPTFKVARGEGYQYNEKRTPSYTDRILWKSADALEDNVVPFLYEPCPDFITSDHKPIRGGYVVKMNGATAPGGESAHSTHSHRHHHKPQIHLLVSDLKCTNLPVMDVGGLSDPYILFISYPKPHLWKKGWPSTKVIQRELNPVWKHDMHLTLDEDEAGFSDGSMLYMTVMDEDLASGDDVIGAVVLNLKALCSELDMQAPTKSNVQKTNVSRPILRNGVEFGELTCTVSAAYLAPKDVKGFLKSADKKVRSKTRGASITNQIFDLLPF